MNIVLSASRSREHSDECSRATMVASKGINIADLANKEVKILIGSDAPEALCSLEVRLGKKNQPHVIRMVLGWMAIRLLKGRCLQQAAKHR